MQGMQGRIFLGRASSEVLEMGLELLAGIRVFQSRGCVLLVTDWETCCLGYFHESQIKLSCLKPALKGVFLMILPVKENDCVGERS